MADEQKPGAEPKAKAEPLSKEVQQWAREKGHIPVAKLVVFRGDAIHSAPHLDVILAHTQWPRNKVVTAEQYDSAVNEAYSIEVR